jgi:hypothetical protein
MVITQHYLFTISTLVLLTITLTLLSLVNGQSSTTTTTTVLATWIPVSMPTYPAGPAPAFDSCMTLINSRKVWLYSGTNTTTWVEDLADPWIIDLSDVDNPVWTHAVTYDADARPMKRSGCDCGSVGYGINQRVILFGGYGSVGSTLIDDLYTFNMTTRTWHMIYAPSDDGLDNPGPIARAWTSLFKNVTVNGAHHFGFFGGLSRPLGGDPNKIRDLSDTWYINQDTLEWYTPDICTQNRTICTDEESLAARFPLLGTLTQNLSNYVVTTSERDIGVSSALTNVNTTLQALNQQLIEAMNTGLVIGNSTCHTVCTATTQVATAVTPPQMEGARWVHVPSLGQMFMIGGYSCTASETATFGDACYHNDWWILTLSNMTWEQFSEPASGDQVALWPSKRAWQELQIDSQERIWYTGGGFADISAVNYWYNDVYCFNPHTRLWLTVTVRGNPPPRRWSAASVFVPSLNGIFQYVSLLFLSFFLSPNGNCCYGWFV